MNASNASAPPTKIRLRWTPFLIVAATFAIPLLLVVNIGSHLRIKDSASRGETELAGLAVALESYKADYGAYPHNEATDSLRADRNFDPREYIAASKHLYACLQPKSGKVYFEFTKSNTQIDIDGRPYVVDPHDHSYGYSTSQFAQSGTAFYDLWTTLGGTREKDAKRWIKNW